MDDKNLLCEIGQRIRKARNNKKLSQEDLAFKAGLSTCSISDIELGKTNLGVLTLIKIIEALDVSADIILRPDVASVNKIYQNEFAELLKDCTPSEIETITKLAKDVKNTLHKSKENY